MLSELKDHGRRVLLAALILAGIIEGASGQELQLNVSSVDTSRFPDISMTVRVTNRNGPLININESNFTVLENGVVQSPIKLECTADSSSPALSLALVMDVSYSMIFYPGRNDVDPDSTKLVSARQAFADFVLNMRPVDEASFMTFARDFIVEQTFTGDKKTLLDVIVNSKPRPGTAIYDAIYDAVQRLRNRPNKKVVVILTDGNDFLSSSNAYDAIAVAQREGVPVFTIGLGSDVDSTTLSLIARQTGGKFIYAPEAKDLKALYHTIAQYIYRGLCTLSYRTSEDCPDGILRVVEVLVRMGAQSDRSLFSYRAPYSRETVQFVMQAQDTIRDNQLVRIPIVARGRLTPGDSAQGSLLCTYNSNHMTYAGYEVSGGIFDSLGISVTEDGSGNVRIRFQGARPRLPAGTVVTLLFWVPDRDTEAHTVFMLQAGSFRQHCDYEVLGDRKEAAITGCPDEVELALSDNIILPSNSRALIPVRLQTPIDIKQALGFSISVRYDPVFLSFNGIYSRWTIFDGRPITASISGPGLVTVDGGPAFVDSLQGILFYLDFTILSSRYSDVAPLAIVTAEVRQSCWPRVFVSNSTVLIDGICRKISSRVQNPTIRYYGNSFSAERGQAMFFIPRRYDGSSATVFLRDARGKRVAELYHGSVTTGEHFIDVVWSGARGSLLSSGMYFLELLVGGSRAVAKCIHFQ